MWFDISFEPIKNPSKMEIIKRIIMGLGIVVFNILISIALVWVVMFGLNIEMHGFELYVAWLIMYMLPAVEQILKNKIGD